MKRLRNALLATMLVATFALTLIGGGRVNGLVACAQERAAKISYTPIPGGAYKIDPAHSIIGFAIRHLEINWVEGRFKDFTGTVRYDEKDVTKSSVEFTAKVESIDT